MADQSGTPAINTTTAPSATGNPLSVVIALSIANIVSILLGTLGNLLVIISVIINRNMRSTTNFFVASLAAADLVVTASCMPLFYIYNVLTWPDWPFGKAGCSILSYLVHMSVMASALSLLSISYDRFLSVFFPMRKFITKNRAKMLVASIWFVSPLLLLPSLLHHDVKDTIKDNKTEVMCVESWDTEQKLRSYQLYRVFFYFLFVLQISVLYFLIGFRLYTRQQPGEQTCQNKAKELLNKRKIIKMLFLVVALFTLCWLPYIINKLLNIYPPRRGFVAPTLFVSVGNFLGLLNSVANPLVYAVLNKNFRTAFKNALRCNCNYEVEQRRRTVSKLTKQTTKRRQSESLTADDHRRKNSRRFENPISNLANRVGGGGDRMRGLSFSSLGQETTIVELKDADDWDSQPRRDSESRRVCFENELFNSTNSERQRFGSYLQNGTHNMNQETAVELSNGISSRGRSEGFLTPIDKNTHSNGGFDE